SRIQGHIGRHDLSLEAAEKSAACLDTTDTELGKIDLLRGHALKILGRRAESEAAYQACIKHTPGNGAGWWGLADLKNYEFTANEISSMQSLAESADDPAQSCQAAFALGKAFENQGDMVAAFKWYKHANNIRPNTSFNAEKHKAFVKSLSANFKEALLSAQAVDLPKGPTPIFILGLPRSGSTLIEQILASHSEIEGTMELTTLPKLERRISIQGGRQFKEKYPHSLKRFTANELAHFGQAYIDETAIYRTDKPYFIDKLPPNYERVGLIHKILPQAIIIDARRNPLDCGYSCYRQHFAAGHEWSYSLEDIATCYNGYLDIMDHWDRVLPGKVTCVQYEDMIRNTEKTVKNLFKRMGLDFEENCLRFFENKRAVRTASSEQVRQPIYTKGMEQWKPLEKQLTPLIESLGDKTMKRFEEFLAK
ncbi:MAG: sulfotransferase, partial [Kordiimonas sp.]